MNSSISDVGLFPFVRSVVYLLLILLFVSNETMNSRSSRIINNSKFYSYSDNN
jgi:hypothetical protein